MTKITNEVLLNEIKHINERTGKIEEHLRTLNSKVQKTIMECTLNKKTISDHLESEKEEYDRKHKEGSLNTARISVIVAITSLVTGGITWVLTHLIS